MTMRQNQSISERQWGRRCCICGSEACDESIDHYFLPLSTLQQRIEKGKRNREIVDELKRQVSQGYAEIRRDYLERLRKDEQTLQEWINQLYFPQLATHRSLLSQLTERNYAQLPTPSIPKLLRQLTNNTPEQELFELQENVELVQQFLRQLDAEAVNSKCMRYLGAERVVAMASPALPDFFSKRSISQISNPEESEGLPDNYEWRSLRVTRTSRVIELSNRNLRDSDLIRELPAISCFRNVKELQIRNNSITALSCRLIANHMTHLTTLDIRCNKIGDQGIAIIVAGMPQLRSLLASQTGMTDESGRLVAKLEQLEMFWGEHNQISSAVALMIGSKPKVKVMSLVGNPIDRPTSTQLHSLFNRKGYFVL